MVDQELKIKFKDQDKTIGILTISAINRNDYLTNLKKTPIKFNKYELSFQNIPKKVDIDTRIPIIYKTEDSRYNSSLMLLEETEYQILFKTGIKSENISFPSLEENNKENIFKKINMGKGYYGGLLNFKSFVGQSFFDIKIDDYKSVKCPFEVRSKKMDYEDNYPAMIADISEALSGLIFREKSPLFRLIDFKDRVKRSFYEDFMFLEYIFRPENLITAYGHVSRDPHHILRKFILTIPAASATYLGPSDVINMINTPGNLNKYDDIPINWPSELQGYFPRVVNHKASDDSFDNPENRFVKYFLNLMSDLIEEVQNFVKERNLEGYPVEKLKLYKEIIFEYLMDRWLDDIGDLDYFPSNSMILQKKEGYRDILNYFVIFELSFSPTWDDMNDLIRGYQKKLSELYEYWCYLELYNVLKTLEKSKKDYNEIFEFNSKEWLVNIKHGEQTKVNFLLDVSDKDCSVDLIYNRTFNVDTKPNRCWSLNLRPDYTLRIYTDSGIFLVHFDAKYKCDLNTSFINEDIYKMHTYKDAIENTLGAYVLYPGRKKRIFQETEDNDIPSVGAIPLTPGMSASDEEKLGNFIQNILEEIVNDKNVIN